MSVFSGSTVLVTGSTSGIGLALAENFLQAGNTVIVTGRRAERLEEIKLKYPQIVTIISDVSKEDSRVQLFETVTKQFPNLNILVNNAGIQREVALDGTASEDWKDTREEITTNLDAPIHLCLLFVNHLKERENAAIINVTSGLAFVPKANVPVYCATKAALHSFTLSLRYQLSKTSVKVIEVIPPAVQTDLGGPGKHTFGVPLQEYIDATFAALLNGDIETSYHISAKTSKASRDDLDRIFSNLNPPL